MVLIIGYGNPVRCDDGLAWHAVQLLQDSAPRFGVHALACHQLTPELAEPIGQAEAVIFIDADANALPGEIQCRAVEPEGVGVMAHHVTPGSLSGAAQELFGKTPAAFMVSMGGTDFGYGYSLSPEVQRALPELVDTVQAIVISVGFPGRQEVHHDTHNSQLREMVS